MRNGRIVLGYLAPYAFIVLATVNVVVEGDNVHYGLWVLFLLPLRNAAFLQHPLPFFWQSLRNVSSSASLQHGTEAYRKLSSDKVKAHVGEVHRI